MPKGTTKRKATEKLREVENQVARGIYIPAKEIPKFNEVAKDWLEYKKPNVRGSTWKMYRSHLQYHFDMVNELKISRITVATVEKFITDRREKGVSLSMLRKVLITFGQVMKYAVRHKYIDHNPVTEAERPKDQGEEKPQVICVLKPTEINALLDAAEEEKYKTLLMLAVMSGARQGELFGLKWSDVLWETSQIYIQRTYNSGAWYRPKSKNSIRKIDLGPTMIKQLKKWKIACPPTKLNLVFPSESGGPLHQGSFVKSFFWPTLKKAGLSKIRFHDLRHTYASLLILQGENIKYIQKQLGHAKATFTIDTYAHLFNDENPEAANKLDDTIFGNGSKMVADR